MRAERESGKEPLGRGPTGIVAQPRFQAEPNFQFGCYRSCDVRSSAHLTCGMFGGYPIGNVSFASTAVFRNPSFGPPAVSNVQLSPPAMAGVGIQSRLSAQAG